MSLTVFAKSELEAAGFFDKDAMYGGMIGEAVMDLLEKFAEQGHSGMSAGITIQVFERLARSEPLGPLTGEDSEWTEVGPGVFQNRRCSHVFRDADGPYDIEGRIFREPSGACFTSRDSRVAVTFPYTPKREYVDVA
jgi:hypothetical protein